MTETTETRLSEPDMRLLQATLPLAREAAALRVQVEALERALYQAACSADPADGLILDHGAGRAFVGDAS